MFSKQYRLSKQEIHSLLKGKRGSTPYFLVMYGKISSPNAKVGFSVSKKIAVKAVDRNRLRRRAYAAMRPYISDLPKGTGILIVFHKKTDNDTTDFIGSQIKEVLKKAHLI